MKHLYKQFEFSRLVYKGGFERGFESNMQNENPEKISNEESDLESASVDRWLKRADRLINRVNRQIKRNEKRANSDFPGIAERAKNRLPMLKELNEELVKQKLMVDFEKFAASVDPLVDPIRTKDYLNAQMNEFAKNYDLNGLSIEHFFIPPRSNFAYILVVRRGELRVFWAPAENAVRPVRR